MRKNKKANNLKFKLQGIKNPLSIHELPESPFYRKSFEKLVGKEAVITGTFAEVHKKKMNNIYVNFILLNDVSVKQIRSDFKCLIMASQTTSG